MSVERKWIKARYTRQGWTQGESNVRPQNLSFESFFTYFWTVISGQFVKGMVQCSTGHDRSLREDFVTRCAGKFQISSFRGGMRRWWEKEHSSLSVALRTKTLPA